MSEARIDVVRGGRPRPQELAALVIALRRLPAAEGPPGPTVSNWQRASVREGVGARPATCPADVELL